VNMPAQKPNGARKFKLFAWQGIRITVPSDWELISTHGDHESGYVGLADGNDLRLQLKCDDAHGKPLIPSDTINAYINRLRKDARRSKTDISVTRNLKLASPPGMECECYEWTSDCTGAGMVSKCNTCGRLVHLVVLGEKGTSMRNLARTVFSSLREHAEGEDEPWNFFDFQFAVPKQMRLRQSDLKTGCIRMTFRHRGQEMEFVRVSLAKTLLAGTSLNEWFSEFYAPELKHKQAELQETEVRGHRGLKVRARPNLLWNAGRLIGRRRLLLANCWHCEPSNRLFIVRHEGREEESATFDRAVQSVQCCE
jgi:hypothetical protein